MGEQRLKGTAAACRVTRTKRIGVGRPRFERETRCRNCERTLWILREEGSGKIENIGRKDGAGRTSGRWGEG